MKRSLITAVATALFFVCAALVLSAAEDAKLSRRDVLRAEVTPVSPRDGRNVALRLEARAQAGRKLPEGVTVLVNDRQVNLRDDGRWPDERAGDGVYAAAGKTKGGEPLGDRTTLRLQSSGLAEHFAPVRALKCTLRAVECPANCESFLFHSKCVVCLKLESCEISFFD